MERIGPASKGCKGTSPTATQPSIVNDSIYGWLVFLIAKGKHSSAPELVANKTYRT